MLLSIFETSGTEECGGVFCEGVTQFLNINHKQERVMSTFYGIFWDLRMYENKGAL